MALIDLRAPMYAKYTEKDGVITYTDGAVIGRAIKADISIETEESSLYSDGAISESEKGFKKGSVTIGIDDIKDEDLAVILGHELKALEDAGETMELIAKSTDDGAYVGTGFYGIKKVAGIKSYRAIWLTKVKFAVQNETFETKGESTNFQTPSIVGTVLTDGDEVWKREATFPKEADAVAYLKKRAGITA